MHFSNHFSFFVALAAGAATAFDTNFDVFSDGGCGHYITTFETNVADGSCNQIGGYESIRTTSVKGGCAVTIYTDSSCSVNAIVAGVGACLSDPNPGFHSYSVDC